MARDSKRRMPRHFYFGRSQMQRGRKNIWSGGWLTASLFLLLTSLGHAQTNTPQLPASKSWAVVIGISKYPKLPGGYQLYFALKDALSFHKPIKKKRGENGRPFNKQEATASAIKEA